MIAIPRQGLAALIATAALAVLPAPASALPTLPIPTIVPLPTIVPVPTVVPLPTTPAGLAALLATAPPAQLTTLIGTLSPAALQAAIGAMTPAQLAAFTAQVQALAAQAGAPASVVALADLLTGTVTGGTGGGTTTTPGGGTTTTTTPGGGTTTTTTPGGGTAAPTTTGGGTTTTTGGSTSTPATAGGATTVNRAIRAAIAKAKLAKNRRSVSVTLSCPATAPGCAVGVVGKLAGKDAFKPAFIAVVKGASATKAIRLSSAAAKRLRRKGGKLALSAGTIGSTLGPATKTVKAAKPKKKHRKR